jgi:FADH2 O2-dependent halogenase
MIKSLQQTNGNDFDVAILGTGIGGTVLAAILARNGVRVLMLEESVHPRFALGESTVPGTTQMFEMLSERYDVPEIANLSTFYKVRSHISSSCGIKRGFLFAYHYEGFPHRGEDTTQFSTFAPPLGPDIHYFRSDVDLYMLTVAMKYGVTVHQQIQVQNIAFKDDGVEIQTNKAKNFKVDYIVDGTGTRSLITNMFDLRETPTRLKTNSRCIFTHMIGVKPYDECGPPRKEHGIPIPLAQHTIHHMFKGGWFWIIPFDNDPSSTNPLCSVGINLDMDVYPKTLMDPEEEFFSFVSKYPSVAKQFENAKAIRGWVSTDRLQFTSKQVVGNRFCLLPQAAGAIDALFSTGLVMTAGSINVLAHRLISAAKDKDYSRERFLFVEEHLQRSFDHGDRLVYCAYKSLDSFELWKAWYRLWILSMFYRDIGAREAFYRNKNSSSPFAGFEEFPYRGTLDLPAFAELFDSTASQVEAYVNKTHSCEYATQSIYRLLQESKLCPTSIGITSPQKRSYSWTIIPILKLILWFKLYGPESHKLRGLTMFDVASKLAQETLEDFSAGLGKPLRMIRDTIIAWNQDWKHQANKRH